jgi:hypothetical protein
MPVPLLAGLFKAMLKGGAEEVGRQAVTPKKKKKPTKRRAT